MREELEPAQRPCPPPRPPTSTSGPQKAPSDWNLESELGRAGETLETPYIVLWNKLNLGLNFRNSPFSGVCW